MLAFVVSLSVAWTTRLNGRPTDCPEDLWNRIVEAERLSREKRFGSLVGSVGIDQNAIDANQLRIWDEMKRQRAAIEAGETPTTPRKEEGPFAGIKKAWQKLYEEADSMGYAQAIALSSTLENKGVLPRVVTKEQPAEPPADIPPRKSTAKKTRTKKKSTKGFG